MHHMQISGAGTNIQTSRDLPDDAGYSNLRPLYELIIAANCSISIEDINKEYLIYIIFFVIFVRL